MRKLLLACFTVSLAVAALSGCRAEGKIDPDGHVSYNHVSPQ